MACVAAPEGSSNPITSYVIKSQEQIKAWEIRAGHVVWGLGPQSQALLLSRGGDQGWWEEQEEHLLGWFDFYPHFIPERIKGKTIRY